MRWSDPLPIVAGAFAVAVGLYLLVVLAFRIGERRTVAELAPFDLAAIIAIGAVVGGTATGRNSLAVAVTAVLGLLLAHALVTRLRRLPGARPVTGRPGPQRRRAAAGPAPRRPHGSGPSGSAAGPRRTQPAHPGARRLRDPQRRLGPGRPRAGSPLG